MLIRPLTFVTDFIHTLNVEALKKLNQVDYVGYFIVQK
jgi:hypothetical protein